RAAPRPSSSLFPYTTLFRSVAPPHEKVVVVVASQEHPVRQRGELGCRALLRTPYHAAFAVRREAVGVFPRVLCGRVPQRGYCDGDRKSTRLNSSHGSISYAV